MFIKPFLKLLVKYTEEIKIGDPMNENTDISALINKDTSDRLQDWLDNAVNGGATICTGGKFDENGNVMNPTVLTDVPMDAKLNCEEAFGPIFTVTSFDQWDDAIQMVNQSKYRIHAGVFTKDIERAHKGINSLYGNTNLTIIGKSSFYCFPCNSLHL
jgi:acyl-CoA reductase-like NAD-dependent aldehyde dehydrogenase